MIIRDKEYYKYHVFNSDDALKHGLEKACILNNIDKYKDKKYCELHEGFPYLHPEKFYDYLEELIAEGELTRNESEE